MWLQSVLLINGMIYLLLSRFSRLGSILRSVCNQLAEWRRDVIYGDRKTDG